MAGRQPIGRPQQTEPPNHAEAADLSRVLGDLFQRKSGQLVATLVRVLGPARIDLAESAVQEAFLKACQHWLYDGVPTNPMGWLTTVARNHTYNRLRRERWLMDKADVLQARQEGQPLPTIKPADVEAALQVDDQLHLMFVCCHPCLPERSQVALTLKTVGGLTAAEVARALLLSEAATRKMLTRAKQKIKQEEVSFAFPEAEILPQRLDHVFRVLYLIFNEGYSATEHPELVRADMCDQAIWLTSLFLQEAFERWPRRSTVQALLALMLLQSARTAARTRADGTLVTLAEQDRTIWDRDRIRLGLQFLDEATAVDEVSPYHVEAQIAALHALAPSYDDAPWRQILACYDTLLVLQPSPVVALNRIVALSEAEGPEVALDALEQLAEDSRLHTYYLLPATYANLYRQLGRLEEAAAQYRVAERLAPSATEQAFLSMQRAACLA